MLLLPSALALVSALGAPFLPQDPPESGGSVAAPSAEGEAQGEAHALWERFLHATYGTRTAKHVSSFSFDVAFLTRGEAGSNEEKMTLRFLEPGFVHLRMRSGREQARGPGKHGMALNWFREKDRVVELKGRDYESDIAEIDRLVALCSNFLTLANPREIDTALLHTTRAPRGLPKDGKVESRSLSWIAFASPEFYLPGSAEGGTYEVSLGIDPETGTVKRALVAELATGVKRDARPLARPVFLAFDDHAVVSGVRVPKTVLVYDAVGRDAFGYEFADRAGVEVYVLGGNLAPGLAPGDFLP